MHASAALGLSGGYVVSARRGEVLCPVCRRLANCLLPDTRFTWGPEEGEEEEGAVSEQGTPPPPPSERAPGRSAEAPVRGPSGLHPATAASASDGVTAMMRALELRVLHETAAEAASVVPEPPPPLPPPSAAGVDGGGGIRPAPTPAPRRRSWDLTAASLALFGRWSNSGAAAGGPPRVGSGGLSSPGTPPSSSGSPSRPVDVAEASRQRGLAAFGPGLYRTVAEFARQAADEAESHVRLLERAVEARAAITAATATSAATKEEPSPPTLPPGQGGSVGGEDASGSGQGRNSARSGAVTTGGPEEANGSADAAFFSPPLASEAPGAAGGPETGPQAGAQVAAASLPPRPGGPLSRRSLPLPSGSSARPAVSAPPPPQPAPDPELDLLDPAAPSMLPEAPLEAVVRLQRPAPEPALMWNLLAHNLAHHEAVHRPPSAVLRSPSTTAASLQGSSDDAGPSLELAGGAQPLPIISVSPVAGSISVNSRPATGGAALLPAVEQAHWRALQSLSSLCCAMGSGRHDQALGGGREDALALLSALSWLRGEDLVLLPPGGVERRGAGAPAGEGAVSRQGSFGRSAVPLDLSSGLLPQYDLPHVQRCIGAYFGTVSVVEAAPLASRGVLLRRDLGRWRQLAGDLLMLVMEMMALGISAFGASVPSSDGGGSGADGASPPSDGGPSGATEAMEVDQDGGGSGSRDRSASSPASVAELLTLLIAAVQPMIWWQAASRWAVDMQGSSDEGQSCDLVDVVTAMSGVLAAIDDDDDGGAAGQHQRDRMDTFRDPCTTSSSSLVTCLAVELLPLLFRLYTLHCLVSNRMPSRELIDRYAHLSSAPDTSPSEPSSEPTSGPAPLCSALEPSSSSALPAVVLMVSDLLSALGLPLARRGDLLSPLRFGAERSEVQRKVLRQRWCGALTAGTTGTTGSTSEEQQRVPRQAPGGAGPSSSSAAAVVLPRLALQSRPRLIELPPLFQDLFLHYVDKVRFIGAAGPFCAPPPRFKAAGSLCVTPSHPAPALFALPLPLPIAPPHSALTPPLLSSCPLPALTPHPSPSPCLQPCPDCGRRPEHAGLCLVTGKLLCNWLQVGYLCVGGGGSSRQSDITTRPLARSEQAALPSLRVVSRVAAVACSMQQNSAAAPPSSWRCDPQR